MDPALDNKAERILTELEAACDSLDKLNRQAASSRADAKRAEAIALLDARALKLGSREERQAHATIAAGNLVEAADIAEMTYRDRLTYIRVLQAQLELVRTQMVTNRDVRV